MAEAYGLRASRKVRPAIFRVRNSQSATGVDVTDFVAVVAQGANQGSDSLHGLTERADVGDLRSDVDAYAGGWRWRDAAPWR